MHFGPIHAHCDECVLLSFYFVRSRFSSFFFVVVVVLVHPHPRLSLLARRKVECVPPGLVNKASGSPVRRMYYVREDVERRCPHVQSDTNGTSRCYFFLLLLPVQGKVNVSNISIIYSSIHLSMYVCTFHVGYSLILTKLIGVDQRKQAPS